MFNIRNITNGNPFENEVEDELPSKCSSANKKRIRPFTRIVFVICLTAVVFILLIIGTAMTAISFPPKPPFYESKSNSSLQKAQTALDGDLKLIGPLMLTAGLFLLIFDVVLCVIVTKEEHANSRAVHPDNRPVSVVGGPFYLATANPNVATPGSLLPFAFSRQLWTIPNAPIPDFTLDEETMKGSKMRPSTAAGFQPPYNPDVRQEDKESP